MGKRMIDQCVDELIEASKLNDSESQTRTRFHFIVRKIVADALNLQANIIETSLPGADKENREKELSQNLGMSKNFSGRFY